jgi:hypothetical protein
LPQPVNFGLSDAEIAFCLDAYGICAEKYFERPAITIPVKLIPGLKRAAPSEVRSVEVLGRGGGIN